MIHQGHELLREFAGPGFTMRFAEAVERARRHAEGECSRFTEQGQFLAVVRALDLLDALEPRRACGTCTRA